MVLSRNPVRSVFWLLNLPELKEANMASTSLVGNNCYHVRSISLPSRSHPLSLRVEEGLNKLKAWATSSLLQAASPTADLLCVGLQALEEMYDCVEELLQLPHTQQALARHQREKWAAEELDSSVRLLDICGSSRDAVSSMKEQSKGLQTTLRTRRPGDSIVEGKICAFVNTRKKAHKDSSRCMKTLKQMEARHPAHPLSELDQDLSLVLRKLEELREITIVVFQSISSFMSKPRRWFPTSRTSKGEQSASELEKVEASLHYLHGKRSGKDAGFGKMVEEAQRRLQGLEAGMGDLEIGLESMFRRLIQNRVSLLNIFSL